jgi:hypothetical protein
MLALAMGVAAMAVTVSAATNLDGRWKIGDGGTCYFDAADVGPDQCDPNAPPAVGRWKLDASSGCVFDALDSGPDQCAPAEASDVSDPSTSTPGPQAVRQPLHEDDVRSILTRSAFVSLS